MYNRVGRGLLIVGRQFRQKLADNASATSGAAGPAIAHCAPSNYALAAARGYCDRNPDDKPIVEPPKLIGIDEDAAQKLEKILAVPENLRMMKIIELEIDVMRQSGEQLPSELRPRHWVELLSSNSRGKRKRYLNFLFGLEKKNENKAAARARKTKEYQEKIANRSGDEEEGTEYKLGANTMFLRFYDTTVNHFWHTRLISRMIFGQKLVFDCSYEKYMTRREVQNCSKQLQLSFAENRVHDDPFDLHLCNANLEGDLMKAFHRFIPTVYNPDFPLTIKTESYLDIFDKDKLIYLTPHCNTEMTKFDHDAVYIIGAFVDKSTHEPVSMAKAKREGIKMMKFPLDRYLKWGSSSGKNLTINQVLNILLDLRLTGSWEEALRIVPRRKLRDFREHQAERKSRMLASPEDPHYEKNSSKESSSYTRPVQVPHLKERFEYKADRSFRPKAQSEGREGGASAPQDFSMKSRMRSKNNWKN